LEKGLESRRAERLVEVDAAEEYEHVDEEEKERALREWWGWSGKVEMGLQVVLVGGRSGSSISIYIVCVFVDSVVGKM
jgi:hypothetical protein